MECSKTREILLAHGWTEAALRDARAVAEHVTACDACRTALADYDLLRTTLGKDEISYDSELVPAPSGPWSAPPSARRLSAWRVGLATAAGVALAVSGWGLRGAMRHENTAIATSPTQSLSGGTGRPGLIVAPPGVMFSAEEVRTNAQVFAGVSEAFDGRAGWVALSAKRSDVGLTTGPIAPPRRLLLLRLTMSRDGQVASRSDVSIVPGQSASLTVSLGGDQQVEYQIATPTEPARLSLWVEVKSPREPGQMLGALATSLPVAPGRVVEAGELVTSMGAYELRVGISQAELPANPPGILEHQLQPGPRAEGSS